MRAQVIISSKTLKTFLDLVNVNNIEQSRTLELNISDGTISSLGTQIPVHNNGSGTFVIYKQSVDNCRKILMHITEQPVYLFFLEENNSLVIKFTT